MCKYDVSKETHSIVLNYIFDQMYIYLKGAIRSNKSWREKKKMDSKVKT